MKKEMTAREFLKDFKRMCESYPDQCNGCPLEHYACCDLLAPKVWDYVFDITAKWAAEHPEPKRTMLVSDETVNVFTIEVTRIGHCEYSQDEKEMAGRTLAYLIRSNIPSVDDAVCIRAQQFITKSHEEEV